MFFFPNIFLQSFLSQDLFVNLKQSFIRVLSMRYRIKIIIYTAIKQSHCRAKEEAAAGVLPVQTNTPAAGWTNNGRIRYNHLKDTPVSQQEYRRLFRDETKNRFSATRIPLRAQSDDAN
jgi:hypothetical protein